MARSWTIAVWCLVFAVAAGVVVGIVASEGRGQASPQGAATDLELSEILAGPARDWDGDGVFDARADEWVEVANRTAVPIDLGSYRISDADSTIRYGFSGVLAPGAVLLVTGKMSEDWERAAGRTATGLSLNNAGDTVILFRLSGPDTIAVDRKTYNSIEGASDRSTGRMGDTTTSWVLFDGLNKYTGSGQPAGTGCAPTPGAVNDCPSAVSETTWGRIKMRFR